MARQRNRTGDPRQPLESALDWLADGVMLVRADGTVAYANGAMAGIAQRGDGIAIRNGAVELADGEARRRLAAALAELAGKAESAGLADFPIPRGSDAPPYLVSLRPLRVAHGDDPVPPRAILFVRDPLSRGATALRLLREVLGLTDAEAGVAQALQSGMRLEDYARARAVSIHTVYAHLRSIKDKTGCRRMGELIRRLNDLQMPLRID
jgi:DNA-binding CsgD family transcriptional regulator